MHSVPTFNNDFFDKRKFLDLIFRLLCHAEGGAMDYTNWAPGEPKPSVDGNDQCLLINRSANYKWQTAACSEKRPFICRSGNRSKIIKIVSKDYMLR
jgi:hypothetical protein